MRPSENGNVDWFDFWINNHEDPDVTKKAQYERWRELRRIQDAATQAADWDKR